MKVSVLALLTSCFSLLAITQLQGDVVTLKNGDSISGKVLEESATEVVLDSPILGKVTLPKEQVQKVQKDAEEETKETVEKTEEAEEVPGADIEPGMSVSERYWEAFTSAIFPKGFTGEFVLGYNYSESSDIQSGIQLGLKGKYVNGKHSVTGDVFYAYTRKKDADGNVTKPTDKHGLNAAYEYDIQDPFFFRASEKYLVDRVKKLEPQNDINALLGWRALDQEKLSLDFAVGPGARYQKTPNTSGEWDPLVTFLQSSFYQFNQSMRFDEKIDYSVDPSDTGSYSLLFEVSASVRLTSFAEPKIIYRNSYDSTVGAGGIKREQSLLVALAVPF
ncbi:DUF481 domain-containing protein [Puniceicoccus vermicola]|uniref:DUF481 domain-containing protein n=1 Tax=Puniceicoccus vermicola TaxID=388746 RepID=A0A7X1E6E5_9BACT|nr:DUF481 domain-containing protein [Puniceicoccus vermicola]MBC2604159.1 DUF481 domain-containing protein [Puniceicoccus vermicola]